MLVFYARPPCFCHCAGAMLLALLAHHVARDRHVPGTAGPPCCRHRAAAMLVNAKRLQMVGFGDDSAGRRSMSPRMTELLQFKWPLGSFVYALVSLSHSHDLRIICLKANVKKHETCENCEKLKCEMRFHRAAAMLVSLPGRHVSFGAATVLLSQSFLLSQYGRMFACCHSVRHFAITARPSFAVETRRCRGFLWWDHPRVHVKRSYSAGVCVWSDFVVSSSLWFVHIFVFCWFPFFWFRFVMCVFDFVARVLIDCVVNIARFCVSLRRCCVHLWLLCWIFSFVES